VGHLMKSQKEQVARYALETSRCPGIVTLSHQGKYAQHPVCLLSKHGFSLTVFQALCQVLERLDDLRLGNWLIDN
jgi:hypothetical protein